MEHNPAAAATNNFGYYKDPLNYTSPTSTYSDIYQLTYPFEDDIKDKRYQYASATGTTLPQSQPSQSQQHQPQAVNSAQYSHPQHQSYSKADYHQSSTSAYKSSEKSQSVINPYANYNYQTYKDSVQYTPTAGYYDQYKFNMGLGTVPTTHYGKTGKDTNYHQNYSPGSLYADSKLASGAPTYCDDVNVAKSAASLVKSTNSSQMSQFPMYTNCYGYPTTASFPNQNYCSYAQSCNDDARILWDEYQTNRRLMSSYVSSTSGVPAAVSVQTPTVPPIPPQSSCRLKSSYPAAAAEYYGTSAAAAAYHAYHATDALRSREKLMYPMNSHVASDSLYTSRSRCLPPMDYKYHQASMPQNMVMPQYDHRYNYMSSDAQTFEYCSPRQESAAGYHHPAYAKSSLVTTPGQKHIRAPPPTAAIPNDFCNTQPYYVCNDQMTAPAGYQDAYSQQCLRDSRHAMSYNVGGVPGARSMPVVSNGVIGKEALYAQSMDGTYYAHSTQHGSQVPLAQNPSCAENSKSSHVKGQNLREFLATWNEDEDDGGTEKMDDTDGGQLYVQQSANFEVEKNSSSENHLQFKGSFNTRPKIHVGITVDSNVANNQYINLPDIIIDIEKPKDTDLISHSIETTQNGNTEKLVLLESVDVPIADLNQYGGLSLLEPPAIEGLCGATAVAANAGTSVVEEQVPVGKEPIRFETMDDAAKLVSNDISVELPLPPVAELLKKSVEEASNDVASPPKTPPRSTGKLKRRKRVVKTKPMFGKIIETKSGKLIRIRKVRKSTVKRRNLSMKKKVVPTGPTTGAFCPSLDDSAKDDEPKKTDHILYNPKTLKDICICYFNSDLGRDLLMSETFSGSFAGQVDRPRHRIQDDHHPKTSASIPKLSALCENALNNFYEEKNVLLLSIDDLDSNLFFIECDINENVVNTTHGDDGVGKNPETGSEFVELFIDDEMCGEIVEEGVDRFVEPDTDPLDHCPNDDSLMESGVVDANDSTCSSTSTNNSINKEDEICLTSDENSRDFSALHHEEIVPDNLHAFENERLRKYLQNKYIQKSNYLKIFVIDKICKKYRKFILKRRRRRRHHRRRQLSKTIDRTMTKKVFMARFRESEAKLNSRRTSSDSSKPPPPLPSSSCP